MKDRSHQTALQEKLASLNEWPPVKEYLTPENPLSQYLPQLPPEEQYVVKLVIAIGQGPVVFQGFDLTPEAKQKFQKLVSHLIEVDSFYEEGILGYHNTLLKIMREKRPPSQEKRFLQPPGMDLTRDSPEVRRAVRWGIETLSQMGEIYPVGGAGDRFNLCDESTHVPLPVAELQFCGHSLLEGLIRDLQAREYLFFKLFGFQEVTPVALMTSEEKDNDAHIRAIFASKNWFGRPPEAFKFFKQPLVPVITEGGDWAMAEPLKMILKPGGHGVIWKLAEEKGVFDWFKAHERTDLLVRQINNPVAATDHGLFALMGIGCHEKKAFGFASCPRLPKAAEGMDVLLESEEGKGFSYCLTNIEYTEFESQGIQDEARSSEDPYSPYPANTNILFADLEQVRKAVKELPLPGMLVNMKTKMVCLNRQGELQEVAAGRLETTMQNIADAIVDRFPSQLDEEAQQQLLSTFITYNARRKTLSVTKSPYRQGGALLGTPEGCLYEMGANVRELLHDSCGMQVPDPKPEKEFLKEGPSLTLLYHPALGPLYSVIAQKIRGGSCQPGSELQLEIAELDVENLNLQGSLLIQAQNILGKRDLFGPILYGPETGKCMLKNVTVTNRGIDRQAPNIYWKNQIARHEALSIILEGSGEFFAENVTFTGNHAIVVPDGHRLVATQEGFKLEKIAKPSWSWIYTFNNEDRVTLNKKMSG